MYRRKLTFCKKFEQGNEKYPLHGLLTLFTQNNEIKSWINVPVRHFGHSVTTPITVYRENLNIRFGGMPIFL